MAKVERTAKCDHCGMPHTASSALKIKIGSTKRSMCCTGCAQAAKMIYELYAYSANQPFR